jgi:hypothetical protein
MTPQETFSTLIKLVPHWYQAEHGPYRFDANHGDEAFHFFSQRNLTPDLSTFWRSMKSSLPKYIEQAQSGSASVVECVQESLVERWLKSKDGLADWKKVISYVRFLLNRTSENLPVAVNLVIDTESGEDDLTSPSLSKFIDQIASSPFTYLRCDRLMRLLAYEEIPWASVTDPISYTFHPEFLHPFHCVLNSSPTAKFSIHVTRNRDVVIMDKEGILAARRKGEWRVYDVCTFKNSIGDAMRGYWLGANLFGVLFDLSFKRHGALLISDPDHLVVNHIVNKDSLLENAEAGPRRKITASIKDLAIGMGSGVRNHRRLLAELASIDGAVVFDRNNVLAIGAVIEPHPGVGSHVGTRTTAAHSALRWGGIPAKVSSDGDVTIYFESQGEGGSSKAEIQFS